MHSIKQLKTSILEWSYNLFVQLIIYPSVWVAAAIASLGIYVQEILALNHYWQPIALIFVTALIPYNLDRIFDSYLQKIPDAKAQLFFRQPCIWALLLLAISTTTGLLIYAPLRVRYVSIVGVIPLLYGIPLFPVKHQLAWRWYRLKDIPGSKAWIVGSVLTYAVIVIPLAYTDIQFDLVTALTTLFMFVFIVTNSHVFDIRDVASDRQKGVVTLPIMAGVKGTKIILTVMNLLMLLTITAAWIAHIFPYSPEIIIATLVNLTYIWQVNIDTPRWVYNILIEGCLFAPIIAKGAIKIMLVN